MSTFILFLQLVCIDVGLLCYHFVVGLHCASKIGVSRVACCSAKNSVGFCFGLLELLMEGAGGLACADDEDDDELFQKMLGPLKV